MRNLTELRPYQDRIATHLYEHDEVICVARPGGGKTVSALTAIDDLLDQGVIRHALVIAPKRVARVVWPDEINEWSHLAELKYDVATGDPRARSIALRGIGLRDITIVGLDVAQWLMEELDALDDDHPVFDLLVIDEISKLRNPQGKRAAAIAKRSKRFKMIWGLSGTLRPSGPQDLFNPAKVVTRGKLWGKSFYTWRKLHFYQSDYFGYDWKPFPGAEDRINAEIAPLIVTLNDDELPQVPRLSIVFDKVYLPADAQSQYDSMERDLFAVDNTQADAVVAASAGVATGKLAQLANGFLYNDGIVARRVHEEKRAWLEDLVEDAQEPILLIYEFLEDLKMLRETIGAHLPYLGAGVTDKQSDKNIADWNAGKLPFMALHPASGGHGLNLQHGGATMAWISPTWSPELWEQTIARLHRSGQKQPVVVRVCTAAGTVDDMKIDRVYRKMTAQQAFEAYLRRHQAKRKPASASKGKPSRRGSDSTARPGAS